MRVRRKHHGMSGGYTTIQRGPRGKARVIYIPPVPEKYQDATSSDDEGPHRDGDMLASCSSGRRSSAASRAQKMFGYQPQLRCSVCDTKLSSFPDAVQCRCGKMLCDRHRPTEMHTCTRVHKLQNVSD
ncbi:unnamed protein product [Gongylonema pulchrum]|uniref:AN1-type domain-containing protein n=1 Tax=Gongylonema pulchrum TaxID=637853 RepID=A0A183DPI6_9BILA|nr:unnamed protein product [Gongylonema pulchrum]